MDPAELDERIAVLSEAIARDKQALQQLVGDPGLDNGSEAALERLSRNVGTAIERTETARRGQRFWVAASVAASIVMAAVVGGVVMRHPVPSPEPAAIVIVDPLADTEELTEGVELVQSPGEARVVELTIGEIEVVMIFDEALDL